MSNNTANIAQAISLLSDVLSREAVADETIEDNPFDGDDGDEFDDLKHQALEFGQEVADGLGTISDELDRTLEASEFDDDDDDWDDDEDDDSEADDADEDQSDTTSDDSTDDEASTPSADGTEEVETLQKTSAALEKSNEELTDKVESLTETLQHIDTLIDDLSTSAKEFVNEVETL